jgi:hypothetical protein
VRTWGWRAFTLGIASITAFGGLEAVVPSVASAAGCPTGPPIAGSILSGVAVTSDTDAWAAGEHYDGTAYQTLAEHWNGTAWKTVTSPNPGGTANPANFSGAAATSTTDAWAVGSYCNAPVYQSLVEHWNGTAWKQIASPSPGSTATLSAVAATSTTTAWAVGNYDINTSTSSTQETLIEHWNGTSWKQVPSPSPDTSASGGPALYSVAVAGSNNAWAVGDYYNPTPGQTLTLIEHWNGTKWVQVASPSPGSAGLAFLYGVAATATNDAWAVGYYYNGTAYQTLILHWNGTKWSQVASPNPAGSAHFNDLLGVTATSASNAWAVGSYSNSASGSVNLILHWNGTKWSQVASPNLGPSFPGDFLSAIAATPTANPWVDGSYCSTTACPARHTLTEHWNGSAWVHVSSP